MSELLTADGLRRFTEVAEAHAGAGTVPGLVALVARGDQVHAVAAGSLSIGGAPVRHDSLFRIASVTKPVTGAATLALVQEGRLRLDEPVNGCSRNWPGAGCCAGWTARWTTPSRPAARSPRAIC